jgi:cytochrome c oxidase subunit IV
MFATIRDKRSLYFRATLISSWGLSLRSSAYLIGYFGISYVPWQFYITLSQIGYVCMVSGFAAVLWSRLGLIYSNERVKKGLKYVMIFNAVTWHPILTIFVMILDAERRRSQPQTDLYQRVRNINEGIEYTQLWFFTCTEILLSCLYIWVSPAYFLT